LRDIPAGLFFTLSAGGLAVTPRLRRCPTGRIALKARPPGGKDGWPQAALIPPVGMAKKGVDKGAIPQGVFNQVLCNEKFFHGGLICWSGQR